MMERSKKLRTMKQQSKKQRMQRRGEVEETSVSTTSKVAQEVVGVAVPRKARSASGKRSHENSSSGNYGGVGQEQSLQQLSLKAASSSFSDVSSMKKMKPNGPKKRTRPPKSSKSSGLVEENIEIEIAEVLYGLMKQSRNSKKPTSNLNDEDRNDTSASMAVQNNLIAESVEVKSEDPLEKMETCSTEYTGGSEGTSGSTESQKEDAKPYMEDEKSILGKVELPWEDWTGTKAISTGLELKRKREDVFKFDLMAPPPMEKNDSADFISNPKPLAKDAAMKMEALVNEEKAEELEEKVLVNKLEEKTEMTSGRPNEKKQPKAVVPKLEKTGGWPSDLSSMGSYTTLQVSSSLLSQPRPKRCATHRYIAHNIYSHQQIGKINNHLPAPTGSAPQCGTKSNILNVILPAENTVISNPLLRMHPQEKEDAANFSKTSQRNHAVHQAPQPASASNQMHGCTLMHPVGQHQTTERRTSYQSGPLKYGNLRSDASISIYSAATPQKSSSALPPVAVVDFNTPKMTATEGPYLAINGYPITISTPAGASMAFGGHLAQAMPSFNGSLYENQMFHPLQVQQKQPHLQLQHQVQSTHQNTSTSSDSSPSHKQLEPRKLWDTQCSSNNFSSSTSLQSLRPCKLELEMNAENVASSYGPKNVYGQNFPEPFQPLNFTLMPDVTMGGRGGGNQIEQSQHQGLKVGVELIPSRAYDISFASFSGNHTVGTSLNFSSMENNQAILEAAKQTNHHHQIHERMTNDSLKSASGKSSQNVGQRKTLVFDNSARTLNFMSSAVTGSWPPWSITPHALTTNVPAVCSTSSSSQKQHLFQFQVQNQHMLQHEQPSVATKLPKNSPTLPQSVMQCHGPARSPHLKNLMVMNFPHQQARASKGQTEISFGGNPKSNNHSSSSLVACSSISTSKSKQIQKSSTGSGQISPPACGRNLPSILTTCRSHISELKY